MPGPLSDPRGRHLTPPPYGECLTTAAYLDWLFLQTGERRLTAYARMLIRRKYGPSPNDWNQNLDLKHELTPEWDPARTNVNQHLRYPTDS